MAKRPRDPVQLAKQVFDIAIGEAEDTVSESKRNPSKRKAGGKKGGKARAEKLTPEQRRYAELIRSSGQMLLTVMNDILDLAKIEAGRMELEIVLFNPIVTTEEVVSMLSVRAESKGLKLNLRTAPELPAALLGDPGRLRQVLFNLVGNALKFTDKGSVDVTTGDNHELTWRFAGDAGATLSIAGNVGQKKVIDVSDNIPDGEIHGAGSEDFTVD